MATHPPGIPCARCADDILCHCRSEAQAKGWRDGLPQRFATGGLALHPEKTRIVYCKDEARRADSPNETVDFRG
jgi:RNA-directed DNA polymerase